MTDSFSRFLELARVSPIFKAGNSTEINIYRPISVLPILSEVFEKIVFNKRYSFFDYFNLLDSSQFNFLKNMSTSDAITDCLQYINDNIGDGHIAVPIFIDYTKGFDSVDLSLVIRKLYAYGLRGDALKWF